MDEKITNEPKDAQTTDAQTSASASDRENGTKKHVSRGSLKFPLFMKARMIESGVKYNTSVWTGIGLGISHVFIGAIIMTLSIYYYTLTKDSNSDAHPLLVTIAYHFFSAEAIMSLSYINGWSTPMRWKHRKWTHVILQICGVFCAVAGTLLVYSLKGLSSSIHSLLGVTTVILTFFSVIFGSLARNGIPKTNIIHKSFGLSCFLMSSLSFISGVLNPGFEEWSGTVVVNILIVFVTFYTIFIVVTTTLKCIKWR